MYPTEFKSYQRLEWTESHIFMCPHSLSLRQTQIFSVLFTDVAETSRTVPGTKWVLNKDLLKKWIMPGWA